jgi:DNA processing protein
VAEDRTERACWLAWSRLEGMGSIRLKRLYEHMGSMHCAWQADPRKWLEIAGFSSNLVEQLRSQKAAIEPEALLEKWETKHGSFLTPADTAYPAQLWEIADPPPVLYYRGALGPWEPAVAIVGTRRASEYGHRWAKKLGFELGRLGFTVVSGLAAGIDGTAHRATLQAQGRTVAVLGCGVDIAYPYQHQRMYQSIIAQGGTILSEYPPGTPPTAGYFPHRNRIVAGLSKATLVLEAPERSGALITAYLAADYGRDVYVLPGSLDMEYSLGCLQLVDRGAHLILSTEQLLKDLGVGSRRETVKNSPAPLELSPEEKALWEILTAQPQPFDQIALKSGLDTGVLSALLVGLELKGGIEQLAGMQYRRGPLP